MVLGSVLRVGLAVLALVAAMPALAQGLDPTSSQNVAPRTGGESADVLEARRKALFARMLRDPANLDIAFEYAAISVRLGDLEGAISTLERMLIFAPGLPRLQYELGVLYYRLGAFEVARTYLNAVAESGTAPPEVQSDVILYLAAIDERASGSVFSGLVTTGLRVQSNANAGPGSAIIDLNGIPFTLNPGALGAPDVNGFVNLNLGASIDLESQGDRFDAGLAAYGALYRTQGQLNTGLVEATAGPTFNLQRIGIDNSTLGFYGILGGAILGGDPYQGVAGLGSRLTSTLDARTRLIIKKEFRYEQFFDSVARPNASDRSGTRFTGSATYQHKLTPDVMLFGTLTLDRRNAQVGYLSTWAAGATLGAAFSFASPIEVLEAPWTFGVSAGAVRQVADAPDPLFSPTTPETVSQLFVQGSLTIPLPEQFALQASAGYLAAFSNYPLGTYDNVTATVGLSKGF